MYSQVRDVACRLIIVDGRLVVDKYSGRLLPLPRYKYRVNYTADDKRAREMLLAALCVRGMRMRHDGEASPFRATSRSEPGRTRRVPDGIASPGFIFGRTLTPLTRVRRSDKNSLYHSNLVHLNPSGTLNRKRFQGTAHSSFTKLQIITLPQTY